MDEELDAVHLSAQLERVSNILEITCRALEDQGLIDSLPDNAFDWWESFKDRRQAEAKKRDEVRKELMLRAIAKLTPEELEALKG
jgi:hypothetical protein